MITKSKARGSGGLAKHLARTDTNESVRLGASRDVTPEISAAMDEIAIRGATSRGTKTIFHVVGNAEPGLPMNENHWLNYWNIFEAEFALQDQAFFEVRHTKKDRDHRHRVYSLVRDDGRIVATSHNYRRNELVSRLTEAATGHPVLQCRFPVWVSVEALSRYGVALPELADAKPSKARSRLDQPEQQQADRLLKVGDARGFKRAVYALFETSQGDWTRFANHLDAARMTIARGTSAILVLDEESNFRLPLARLLREEAKRGNQTVKVRSKDLEQVFARAKPVSEEIQAIQLRRGLLSASDKKPDEVTLKRPSAATEELSRRMTEMFKMRLAVERRRRSRLDENSGRTQKRRRPLLDMKLAAIADIACLHAGAHVIACFREGRLALRSAVLIVALISTINGVGPALLAAAAVGFLRRKQINTERALRADIDDAKAGRSGFFFKDVADRERSIYAKLIRSGVFVTDGPSADRQIELLGQKQAAAFIAWWTHASELQKNVVKSWGTHEKDMPIGGSAAIAKKSPAAVTELTHERPKAKSGRPKSRHKKNSNSSKRCDLLDQKR